MGPVEATAMTGLSPEEKAGLLFCLLLLAASVAWICYLLWQ